MSFISDGKRTWDPERGIELILVRRGFEFQDFKLESPAGCLLFAGELSTYKTPEKYWKDVIENPNINTIIDWHILLNFCFPGMDEEQTRQLVRQAMKSYEWLFGGDSLNGYPPHDVVCRFSGSLA